MVIRWSPQLQALEDIAFDRRVGFNMRPLRPGEVDPWLAWAEEQEEAS